MVDDLGEFYIKYYVTGKFDHEFLEFEFRPDGKFHYANNSNCKNDSVIRKEIVKEDDNNWPESNRVGRHELEIVMENKHCQKFLLFTLCSHLQQWLSS